MKQNAIATILMISTAGVFADDEFILRAEFESLQFLVDACWVGQFPVLTN